MERIKHYYRLSALKTTDKLPTPIYNQIDENVLSIIVTQRQANLFLKKDKSTYKLKETIIGGGNKQNNKMKEKISKYQKNNKKIIVLS